MVLHTRLRPASNAGATVLATHFISQLAPDIRRKLKKAEDGPQTPIRDLVNMAFKGLPVLIPKEDSLLYAGSVRTLQPPDM